MGYVLLPAEVLNSQFYPWSDLQIANNALPFSTHHFFGSDPFTAHYPWKFIGIEMLKTGQWPLWNPYSFAGSPLLANGQSALFYPLNFVYFILDFNTAWNSVTILQIILSGVFCFLLLREYKLSKFSCLWGGMIYAWNGYLANYLQIQVIGQALIWLPLALFAIIKLKSPKAQTRYFLLLIITLASILLAGYLQTTIYSLLIICLFVLICHRELLIKFIISLILSFGLSAPQLFPVLGFLGKSERSASLFYDYFSFLAPPAQLVRLLMPRFFGHPNSENWWGGMLQRDHVYIGVMGLIFVVLGIYYVLRNKIFVFWVLLLVLFLVFTIESEFSNFFYNLPIPLLNSVTPSRGLGMLVLPLSFLSALGMEQFIQKRSSCLKIILVTLLCFTAVNLYFYINTLNNFSQSLNIIQAAKQSFFFFLIPAILLTILVVIYFKKILPPLVIFILIFTLQSGDLLKENKFFSRTFVNQNYLYPSTPLTDFLSKSNDRFLSLDLWLLIPNSFLPYHLYSITAYDALHLNDSYRFMKEIFQKIPQGYPLDPRSIRYSNINKQLASLLNIRYVLSLSSLTDGNFNFVDKIGSVYVYENAEVMPRAFLVPDVVVLGKDQIAQRMFHPSVDFKKVVFLEEKPPIENNKVNNGWVNILRKDSNSSSWRVYTEESQILFLSETYDSGWEAFIDGEKTKVYKANLAFQAIVIPAGYHQVEVRYNPTSFRLGGIIFIISFISLIFVSIMLSERRTVFKNCF